MICSASLNAHFLRGNGGGFREAVVTLAAVYSRQTQIATNVLTLILTTIKSNGGRVGFPYQILEGGSRSHRNSWKMH